MSEAEELAALNSDLDQALERFDSDILSEREAITQQENATAGGATTAGPEGAGDPSEAGFEGASGGQVLAASGDSAAPAIPASPRPGNYKPEASAAPLPEDIPDGSDDDVVARQIREAAMAETDPELREKLWEEYRKYKQR
jgi:hypothetical protein